MPREAIAYLVGIVERPLPIFPGDRLTFGRVPGNSHILEDGKISRNHAELVVTGIGLITLEDLGSTNGTLLNDQRLQSGEPTPLKSGDTFALGGVVITLLADKSSHIATSIAKEKSRLGSGISPDSDRMKELPGVGSQDATRRYKPIGPRVDAQQTQIRSMTDSVVARLNEPCPSEGQLEDYWFAQLLQAQHRDERTGELTIQNDGEEAVISFAAGKIIFAMLGDYLGVDVIAQLSGWKEGTYRFKNMSQIQRPNNILLPTKSIILHCCQFNEDSPG